MWYWRRKTLTQTSQAIEHRQRQSPIFNHALESEAGVKDPSRYRLNILKVTRRYRLHWYNSSETTKPVKYLLWWMTLPPYNFSSQLEMMDISSFSPGSTMSNNHHCNNYITEKMCTNLSEKGPSTQAPDKLHRLYDYYYYDYCCVGILSILLLPLCMTTFIKFSLQSICRGHTTNLLSSSSNFKKTYTDKCEQHFTFYCYDYHVRYDHYCWIFKVLFGLNSCRSFRVPIYYYLS